MGIDPVTHKPKADALGSSAADGGHSRSAANLSHMAQWESARLEAEARLARESKLRAQASAFLHPPSSPPLPPPPPQPQMKTSPPCLDVLRAWQGVWSKPATAADRESPTSTSSFSETLPPMMASMGGLLDVNSTICHGSEFEGEEVEWKCFDKPARASGDAFSVDEESIFGDNAGPWLGEGDGGIDAMPAGGGDFAAGFTGMLLEGSGEHNNSSEGCGESDNVDGGGSCVEEGEEENKNYWSSILNLVNSSSPSNSPPVF